MSSHACLRCNVAGKCLDERAGGSQGAERHRHVTSSCNTGFLWKASRTHVYDKEHVTSDAKCGCGSFAGLAGRSAPTYFSALYLQMCSHQKEAMRARMSAPSSAAAMDLRGMSCIGAGGRSAHGVSGTNRLYYAISLLGHKAHPHKHT